jgi:hypothetical protein
MIPKPMEIRARLLVLACLGVILIGSVIGLIWMSIYAVK